MTIQFILLYNISKECWYCFNKNLIQAEICYKGTEFVYNATSHVLPIVTWFDMYVEQGVSAASLYAVDAGFATWFSQLLISHFIKYWIINKVEQDVLCLYFISLKLWHTNIGFNVNPFSFEYPQKAFFFFNLCDFCIHLRSVKFGRL